MLSLEQKLQIVESFPELERKDVSLGRINFHYEDSIYDKKNVVYHLHPNGNGFVYAELVKGYAVDAKGMVNIRDYSETELREIIAKSIRSLSGNAAAKPDKAVSALPTVDESVEERAAIEEEVWQDEEGHTLTVSFVEDLWYVYAGENLDCAFETYDEVCDYLHEEGFLKK